jgi:hypothetical protein
MNARIKLLAEQAGLYMEDQHLGGFPNEEALVAKKFAELIIIDCIKTMQNFKYEGVKFDSKDLFQATHNATLEAMIEAFREDFGVEK